MIVLLLTVCGLASASAQEGAGQIAAPPVPANPPTFAPQGNPGGAPAPPGASLRATPAAAPTMTTPPAPVLPARTTQPEKTEATPPKPTGAIVTPRQSRSRVIEDVRPERVKVYPEDPDSAWWEINPRYAFARAQREQKPLLLLFTGTWNTQAMALSSEVFSTQSFNKYVKESLIICYLNYPRNFTDAPDSMRRVKDKFKVRGYPNVLLFNPNGEVEKGIRGYRSGRPVDYFQNLRNHCQPILDSIENQKAALVRYGYRDWSNYQGKILFAKFIDRDPDQVRLQDVSGQKWIVKMNDLAPDDQRLVESFPAVDALKEEEDSAP